MNSCSRTVTFLVKILHSGPPHEFVQFDFAGYTVRRRAQQAELDAGKVRLLGHCNSCIVSCLTKFNYSNKLYCLLEFLGLKKYLARVTAHSPCCACL